MLNIKYQHDDGGQKQASSSYKADHFHCGNLRIIKHQSQFGCYFIFNYNNVKIKIDKQYTYQHRTAGNYGNSDQLCGVLYSYKHNITNQSHKRSSVSD